jgi:hypothetical protein
MKQPNAEPSTAPLAGVWSETSGGTTSRQQSASRRRSDEIARRRRRAAYLEQALAKRPQAAALCRVDRAQVRDAPAASAARLGWASREYANCFFGF